YGHEGVEPRGQHAGDESLGDEAQLHLGWLLVCSGSEVGHRYGYALLAVPAVAVEAVGPRGTDRPFDVRLGSRPVTSLAADEGCGGLVGGPHDLAHAVLELEDQPHLGAEALVLGDLRLAEAPLTHGRPEGQCLEGIDDRSLVGASGRVDGIGQ